MAITPVNDAAIFTDSSGRTRPADVVIAANTPSPHGSTQLNASSGNQANATATATLTPASGKTAYITGFEVTGAGATAAAVKTVTLTGVLGGTLSYTFTFPTGATLTCQPLAVEFTSPLVASAADQAIAVSCPAAGAGNTNTTVTAHGFYL